MKEFLIIILLLGAAIWPALSQSAQPATNVLVGEFSIIAVYPEMAEFVLNCQGAQITVVRIHEDGTNDQSTYTAILTQTEPDVYRAEFCGESWVEVNAATGSTTMCHKGKTEAFFPPGIAGR